jgi:hypothetical protein
MNHLSPRVYGFLLGGIQGATLWLVFAIGFAALRNFERRARVGLSLLLAALGVWGPVFVGELGASQNDTTFGLFVLAAIYLFVRELASGRTLAERRSWRALLLGSILFGAGVGLKLTLLLYGVGAAIALLAVSRSWRERAVVLGVWSGGFLVGFLVTNGYWMARVWNQYGNPFFPFFNNVFRSEWAEPLSFADRAMVPRTVWSAVTLPFRFAYSNDFTERQHMVRDLRYGFLYVLLLASLAPWLYRLVARRSRAETRSEFASPDARFLIAFFCVSFVVWEAQFSIVRYVASLEALAPLVTFVVAYRLMQNGHVRTAVLAAALASTAILMRPAEAPRVAWGDEFWEVTVPTLPNPSNSLIIIPNPRPWGYFVPFFPREVRWLNVNSNFTGPKEPSRTQQEIRRILNSYQGDMYVLSRAQPSVWYAHDRQLLASYGLGVLDKAGMPIASKHSRDGLHLWPLVRFQR